MKHLNNPFANLASIVPAAVMALGRKSVWRVEFRVGFDTNARTVIPDMPLASVEQFMIMKRHVGRGQIVNVQRIQVNA